LIPSKTMNAFQNHKIKSLSLLVIISSRAL
jgi:hypothetical protein